MAMGSVEEEQAALALQLDQQGQGGGRRLRELPVAQEVCTLEAALLLVEEIDRQPFRPQGLPHRACEMAKQGR
jgi:hypothetical protein